MEAISLRELVSAVEGVLLTPETEQRIPCVDTDSRDIHPGSLFIPLAGERFDGHAYLEAALRSGAAGCLTAQEPPQLPPGHFVIRVGDTEKALGALAAWYKRRFAIPFVAITGSVGKTTTKDMIAAVLGAKYKVHKTQGNLNNNIGLPLTLLGLEREHQVCVLEMGMDRPGEIDYLAGLVKPEVGVITNIGDAHIQRLGSRENIFRAKCELLPHIQPEGLLILNGDDAMLSTLRDKSGRRTVFYGTQPGLEYFASQVKSDGVGQLRFQLHTPSMEKGLSIPAPGSYMVYPALAASAVGEALGLSSEEIARGAGSFVPTRMRMNVLRRGRNITILDDSYNANPQSMRAALSVLADTPAEYKVAVLGDMLELGPFAPSLHEGVGEYLGKQGIDCLVAVGELAESLAEGARRSGAREVYHCGDQQQAKEVLSQLLRENSTFLVKASRGMKLEALTAWLLEHTEEAE